MNKNQNMSIIRQALLLMSVVLLTTGLIWLRSGAGRHSVTLNWKESPSTPTARVVGYNVYRSATGAEYARIASRVSRPPYEDRSVKSGETYFYVVTAVDQIGRESKYSAETRVRVP